MTGGGSQHNKAHKAGRRAGRSAREKHRDKKDASARASIKSSAGPQSRADRLNTARQGRENHRAALLAARRSAAPPRVVALVPLSARVDVSAARRALLLATAGAEEGLCRDESGRLATVSATQRQSARFSVLPALSSAALADPLCAVQVGTAADVLLLLLPAPGSFKDEALVDEGGQSTLRVLRAMGLPTCVGVCVPEERGEEERSREAGMEEDKEHLGSAGMEEEEEHLGSAGIESEERLGSAEAQVLQKLKAQARKAAVQALEKELGSDPRCLVALHSRDWAQVVRALVDLPPSVPLWRRARPQILVERAEVAVGQDGASETLVLEGYVRNAGLDCRRALHIPGAGDFAIARALVLADPHQRRGGGRAAAEGESADGATAEPLQVVEVDPSARDPLEREHAADPTLGEQTWPTEEDMEGAEGVLREAAGAKTRRRKLPPGTSEYQASWILDDQDEDEDDEEEEREMEEEGPRAPALALTHDNLARAAGECPPELVPLDEQERGDLDMLLGEDADAGTEYDAAFGDDERGADPAGKKARRDELEDAAFPDEVDTPADRAASVRFARYRGLKSFRTSPWDPRESLPRDYARVFAFDNPARARKKALELARLAGAAADASGAGVPAGSYVRLFVRGLTPEQARAALARAAQGLEASAAEASRALPLCVTGLLQHETRLSVLHFGVSKARDYAPPLANKEEVLLVTGVRAFEARPAYSTDTHGADKHKMERYLHAGRPSVGTVYAPIAFGPLPLLCFKRVESGALVLAASGNVRGADPDRILLKKIVLAGYPVRAHKGKAVVKHMFYRPEDVRWFRPVELWTKGGRRGRIREPLGTHGQFKAVFDGPIGQQDAVAMSLYKRVFPKWPASMAFA